VSERKTPNNTTEQVRQNLADVANDRLTPRTRRFVSKPEDSTRQPTQRLRLPLLRHCLPNHPDRCKSSPARRSRAAARERAVVAASMAASPTNPPVDHPPEAVVRFHSNRSSKERNLKKTKTKRTTELRLFTAR
jgi:hypothetical protein